MPPQKPYTFAIRTGCHTVKNCKRVCLATQKQDKMKKKPAGNNTYTAYRNQL